MNLNTPELRKNLASIKEFQVAIEEATRLFDGIERVPGERCQSLIEGLALFRDKIQSTLSLIDPFQYAQDSVSLYQSYVYLHFLNENAGDLAIVVSEYLECTSGKFSKKLLKLRKVVGYKLATFSDANCNLILTLEKLLSPEKVSVTVAVEHEHLRLLK